MMGKQQRKEFSKEKNLKMKSMNKIKKPIQFQENGLAKKGRNLYKKKTTKHNSPLELVHVDIYHKMSTIALGGTLYFLLLVDVGLFLYEKAIAIDKFRMPHML